MVYTKTISLWIWYLVVFLIAFLVFFLFAKMAIWTSVLCASLFALIIGLVLLPYYQTGTLTSVDTSSLNAFITVASVIPVIALIIAVLSGEHKKYWNQANPNNHKQPINVIIQNPCAPIPAPISGTPCHSVLQEKPEPLPVIIPSKVIEIEESTYMSQSSGPGGY